VVVALSGLLYASMKEEVQFWKYADEVAAAPGAFQGKRLNVGGHVKSIAKQELDYQFEIETRPPRPYAVVKARYHGLVPDTFKPGGEVVATGKIAGDGTLEAEQIMAKCPSKYEAKGPSLMDEAPKKY
jgi:cytochrome c-type biogenesis protein CcmE